MLEIRWAIFKKIAKRFDLNWVSPTDPCASVMLQR